MTLIDLNDPKNAASRGDVPEAVRWLVEVPCSVGEPEPAYAHEPEGTHWFVNEQAGLPCLDYPLTGPYRFARPATAAEIAANCPEILDGSTGLRETLEAVLAYLDKRTGVFIPDKDDFFAACKIRGTVIATLKESSRANAN